MKKIILILILLASSCAKIDVKSEVPLDSFQQEVRTEFLKIESEEDRETIYTIFAGSAAFLDKAKLTGSENFEELLGKVRGNYSWDVDKYPKLTDSVEKLLINRGYDEPRDLSKESDRKWLAKIFEDLATATKE